MKYLEKQVLHLLMWSSNEKLSCTNLGRLKRNNCSQVALFYNNNATDLQFMKHNHWG